MKKINKDIKELAFENIIWKSSIANRKVIESFYDYFNGLIKQNGGKYEITFEKKNKWFLKVYFVSKMNCI